MLHVHNCLVWKRDEGWQGVLSFGDRGGEHFGHYGGSGGGVFILFMESGCCGGGGDQSLNLLMREHIHSRPMWRGHSN